MTNTNNIVIIGGGHNGLVCAAYLAKAGKNVTVLEASEEVGGPAATREFAPGYKASCAHLLNLLDDGIREELELSSNGLSIAKENLTTIALAKDGNHITITPDSVEGSGLTAEDKAAYAEYRRFMTKFAGIIGAMHNLVPPRITTDKENLVPMAKLAWKVRMLGRDDMRELLRIGGINIYDVLKENFDKTLEGKSLLKKMNELKYWQLYCDLYPIMTEQGSGRFPQQFSEEFMRCYENRIAEFKRLDRGKATQQFRKPERAPLPASANDDELVDQTDEAKYADQF